MLLDIKRKRNCMKNCHPVHRSNHSNFAKKLSWFVNVDNSEEHSSVLREYTGNLDKISHLGEEEFTERYELGV